MGVWMCLGSSFCGPTGAADPQLLMLLQTSKAKQAELSAKESAAFLPDHHCTRGRSPQGKRNDSGPYMHRMMRFEPSCEKTKLHGQKDKVHDLKGTACTKLSLLLFCWPFAIWSLRISCRL